ncbi:hypothetical protein BJ742DRAFT_771538 [Cladochytrium replicatum]|nr:hypothetical protein BJ742DRAFT_771538 [Cladochytrium replicatum]
MERFSQLIKCEVQGLREEISAVNGSTNSLKKMQDEMHSSFAEVTAQLKSIAESVSQLKPPTQFGSRSRSPIAKRVAWCMTSTTPTPPAPVYAPGGSSLLVEHEDVYITYLYYKQQCVAHRVKQLRDAKKDDPKRLWIQQCAPAVVVEIYSSLAVKVRRQWRVKDNIRELMQPQNYSLPGGFGVMHIEDAGTWYVLTGGTDP